MRFWMRRPSLRWVIGARTSGRRLISHSLGLKAGRWYWIFTNPQKYAYNKVYSKTTFSIWWLARWLFK